MNLVTGTVTLANGTTVDAIQYQDGSVVWSQNKMIRHGSGTATQGVVSRKATAKQAATFTLDAVSVEYINVQHADILKTMALEVHASVSAIEMALAGNLADALDMVAADRKVTVMVTNTTSKPWECSNFQFMALNATTASARKYWERKVALAA